MMTLYVKNSCQFCNKVLAFVAASKIGLITKDIVSDPQAMEELLRVGGKRQVPFLLDLEAGVAMYESAEIIDHLRKRYVG